MAVNTLAISYTDLQEVVGLELGWKRDPDLWSATQDRDFSTILKDGLRQFYNPPVLPGERSTHDWSFLYPIGQLDLVDSYSTGTIAVAAAASEQTALIDSGTWPSWAAQGTIYYTATDGTEIAAEVTTRTDGDYLIFGDTDSKYAAAASTSYVLRRVYYDLPDDFGGMESDGFNYRRDSALHLPFTIKRIGEADLRTLDRQASGSLYPRYFSITYVAPTSTQSSRPVVRFFPLAQSGYYLDYRYRAIPPALDGSTYVYPYGGAEHADTIQASVIDKAYQRLRDSSEYHEAFLERLRASVLHDRRQNTSHTLGYGPQSNGGRAGESLADIRRKTPFANITTSF